MVEPPRTAEDLERRIAGHLRATGTKGRSRADIERLVKGYVACLKVAHKDLPPFDLTRVLELACPPTHRVFRT